MPATTMLDQVRITAHIVKVRLDRLLRENQLTPEDSRTATAYRDQLNRLIRKALYTLHPDQYAFCAGED